MTGRHQRALIAANLPPGWSSLFAYAPGRTARMRCLLCGRTGYGGYQRPAPWQLGCIGGHRARCPICKRPFVHEGALSSHLTCKLHHACCLHHTTVPGWKNPFRILPTTIESEAGA